MISVKWLLLFELPSFTSGTFTGPSNINELVDLAFGDHMESPTFTPLPSWPNIAVARNDTATLKVMDLAISHYPVKKGRVTFRLDHLLTQNIPLGSYMEIISYVNGSKLFRGTVPLCKYLEYARLDCPIQRYSGRKIESKTLQIPETAKNSRLGFIVFVNTPQEELILQMAGILDLVQDGTIAEEEPTIHGEL